MSGLITPVKQHILLWKIFYIKVILTSIITFGAAWQLGAQNVSIQSLDGWESFNLVVGILVLWGTNMVSLLDKTASQIQSGRLFDEPQSDPSKQQENG